MNALPDNPTLAAPAYSINIAVYDGWGGLDGCLRSLACQAHAPSFEVIVVDDGSHKTAPEQIRRWSRCFPLTIVRQPHAGIATARNRGVEISWAPVVVFVDADCRLHPDCLLALHQAILQSPEHRAFQLRLIGDCSSLAGRSEDLRLRVLQDHLLQPDGCIRYLNTAGFALRRAHPDGHEILFDTDVSRGEDTMLLVELMARGEMPRLVADAIVQHVVPSPLTKCVQKAVECGCQSAHANRRITARGIRIRLGHMERLKVLATLSKVSARPEFGRSALGVLLVRQVLERVAGFVCQCLYALQRSRRPAISRWAHNRRRAPGGLVLPEATPAEVRSVDSIL